ncbi:MAG: HEPN domain-containing protein [Pseudomonadota bacterium]
MTSPSHLPAQKQEELNKITKTIRDNCSDIEKIILFGSYARGDYKEAKDLKENRKSGHISDYDILAITTKKETALDFLLWKKITEACKILNLSASPRIITHDIEALNIKLAEGQYFYSDIKKEGITLFDAKNFELAEERDLTPKEKQRIAQEHFDHWFKRSENFLRKFELMFSENQFTDAAFDLHQSAESAYKTVLLVFSNYNPNEHFLGFLGDEAEKYSDLLKNIFSKITEEDEDRFRLLEYAYIGARYDPEYRISKEDLEILATDVQKLLQLTRKVCEEKVKSF